MRRPRLRHRPGTRRRVKIGTMNTPQRYVVLDTETTGLNPKTGDRIIEIGCVEIIDRRVSGRHYHTYLDPEREIDAGATAAVCFGEGIYPTSQLLKHCNDSIIECGVLARDSID